MTWLQSYHVSKGRLLTNKEERGGQVDADELDAAVADEAEASEGASDGADGAEQAEDGLGAHPVAHHARCYREQHHDDEGGAEVWYHGARVLLQLQVEGARGEARRRDVLPQAVVLRLAHRVQERFLPTGTPATRKTNKVRRRQSMIGKYIIFEFRFASTTSLFSH
jgi:hypothetical protein